jgi:hypothetical protein
MKKASKEELYAPPPPKWLILIRPHKAINPIPYKFKIDLERIKSIK